MVTPTPGGLFDEQTLRACSAAARRVERMSHGYVEYDDLLSACYEWVVRKQEYVLDWRELGAAGGRKLKTSLYRAAMDEVSRERRRRTGCERGDMAYYTRGLVEELLPDVFSYDGWTDTGSNDYSTPKGKSSPSEGNHRLAMLVDVKWAVARLSEDDQLLLRDRYEDGGTSLAVLSATCQMTEDGMRKKVDRILDRVVERLGGEPPWHVGGSRRAVSNAAAQAAVKES